MSDTDNTDCTSTVQSDSDSSAHRRHNKNRERTVTNATTDLAASAEATVEVNAATPAIHPTLARIAKSLRGTSRTPKHRRTAASGTKNTRGTAENGSVTKWKLPTFPATNFQQTWRGIPVRAMTNEGVGRQLTVALRRTNGHQYTRKDSLTKLILFLTTNHLSTLLLPIFIVPTAVCCRPTPTSHFTHANPTSTPSHNNSTPTNPHP